MATSNTVGLRSSASIVPLISTSCGLFYAFVERGIFESFLKSAETDRASTNRTVHLWWKAFFHEGLGTILTIGVTTLVGGVYTLRSLPPYSRPWYTCAAGITLGLGHFTFGPTIAEVIKNLCDEEVERENKTLDWLREWLRLHRMRTLLFDVPAFAAFSYLVFGHLD